MIENPFSTVDQVLHVRTQVLSISKGSQPSRSVIALIGGNFLVGFSSLFILLCGLDPLSLGFYRMGCAAVVLAVILFSRQTATALEQLRRTSWQWWALAGIGAVAWTAELSFWQLSIFSSGAGIATLLNNIQLCLLPFLCALFFGDPLRRSEILTAGIAASGLYLLCVPAGGLSSSLHLDGIVWGLVSGVCYTMYLVASRGGARSRNAPRATVAMFIHCAATTILFLLTSLAVYHRSVEIPSLTVALLLFTYAAVCQVLGWIIVQRSVHGVSGTLTAICLLIQPLMAFLTDIIYTSRSFTWREVIGAFIIVFSVVARGTAGAAIQKRRSSKEASVGAI